MCECVFVPVWVSVSVRDLVSVSVFVC
jgi:hypothetical protein